MRDTPSLPNSKIEAEDRHANFYDARSHGANSLQVIVVGRRPRPAPAPPVAPFPGRAGRSRRPADPAGGTVPAGSAGRRDRPALPGKGATGGAGAGRGLRPTTITCRLSGAVTPGVVEVRVAVLRLDLAVWQARGVTHPSQGRRITNDSASHTHDEPRSVLGHAVDLPAKPACHAGYGVRARTSWPPGPYWSHWRLIVVRAELTAQSAGSSSSRAAAATSATLGRLSAVSRTDWSGMQRCRTTATPW